MKCTIMGKSYSEKVRSRNARKGNERNSRVQKAKTEEEKPSFPVLPMVVLAIVGLLMVSGFVMYALDTDEDSEGSNNEDSPDDNNNDNIRDEVPRGEIRIDSTQGSEIFLDQYKGKVVVLDMFATWCNPCRMQMEELDELQTRFSPNELVILSVGADLGETLAQLREFEKEEGATWPFARSSQLFNQAFPAGSIPTLYLLDTNGGTAEKFVGVTDADTLESEVRSLL
jgi:cytochrome c-type biogenesis protein